MAPPRHALVALVALALAMAATAQDVGGALFDTHLLEPGFAHTFRYRTTTTTKPSPEAKDVGLELTCLVTFEVELAATDDLLHVTMSLLEPHMFEFGSDR